MKLNKNTLQEILDKMVHNANSIGGEVECLESAPFNNAILKSEIGSGKTTKVLIPLIKELIKEGNFNIIIYDPKKSLVDNLDEFTRTNLKRAKLISFEVENSLIGDDLVGCEHIKTLTEKEIGVPHLGFIHTSEDNFKKVFDFINDDVKTPTIFILDKFIDDSVLSFDDIDNENINMIKVKQS